MERKRASDPDDADDLPSPSAELVLIRVFVSAHLATISRRKGEAFLKRSQTLLDDEQTIAALLPIRPAKEHAQLAKARREAAGMFNAVLPALIASLPRA